MENETGDQTNNIWIAEGYQEKMMWKNIQKWNALTNFFDKDDVIGFGDTDEIASRQNVHTIKYCRWKGVSIDVGIWFPYSRVDQAFQTDYPVRGHPYTLGDPSYFTFESAAQYVQATHKYPTRRRGKSGPYLLGGMHMSHYGYLPYHLVKESTATEGVKSYKNLAKNVQILADSMAHKKLREYNDEISIMVGGRSRIKKLDTIPTRQLEGIVYFPWFYNCNRDRYPRWEGKWDTRLGF